MTSNVPGTDATTGIPPLFEVAVVGTGPAGITAAAELVRYGRSVVAFERDRIGGLVHEARRVENVPWASGAMPGLEVARALEAHLQRFAPEFVDEEVVSVQRKAASFEVRTHDRAVRARAVVLACGTRPRALAVRGEDLPWVATRWTDLRGHRGTVAVVGGGDLAIDQALSLAEAGFRVELLVRGEHVECNRPLMDELGRSKAITQRFRHVVEAFVDGPARTVLCSSLEGPQGLPVDCALVSIGREQEAPRILDTDGRALKLDYLLAHGIKGVFLAGDLAAYGRRRQVAIAAGSGLDAAMRCEEHLREGGA